jgi:hypothetical protein
MPYPTMPGAQAKRLLIARRSGNRVPDSSTRDKDIGPDFIVDKIVPELKTRLAKRQKEVGDIEKGSGTGGKFEALASRNVHEILPRAHPALGDPEFWIWLAVEHFADLIEWRYGDLTAGCDLKNYGIGSRGENFLYRLWLRGELGYDPDGLNPYELAGRGDVDFWRSHLFRQRFANARIFARAWLRFQFPEPDKPPRLSINGIRQLVKRLRRLGTNLVVELLDESAATRLIEAEASKTTAVNS